MTTQDIGATSNAIAGLYGETGVAAPTEANPIVPLSLIINHLSLLSTELPSLTVSGASNFLLRRGGAVDQLAALTSDPLAGFLYVTRSYGCVFVDRNDLLVRRRFSAAHELGHYLLHFRPALSRVSEESGVMLDAFLAAGDDVEPDALPSGRLAVPSEVIAHQTEAELEREANQFAAELLMPRQVVYGLLDRYQRYFEGDDLVRRLASALLVSQAATRWRLRSLGVWADGIARWN